MNPFLRTAATVIGGTNPVDNTHMQGCGGTVHGIGNLAKTGYAFALEYPGDGLGIL